MEKDYIDRKVKQCRKLVRESTDPAQRKVYREYLKLWQEKAGPIPVKKSKKEKPVKVVKEEPEPEKELLIEIPNYEEPEIEEGIYEGVMDLVDDELEPENFQTLKEATGLSVQDLLDNPILPETPIDYAAEFEKEFPNKMAYRRKDGKLVETIAFKEFLKERTQ